MTVETRVPFGRTLTSRERCSRPHRPGPGRRPAPPRPQHWIALPRRMAAQLSGPWPPMGFPPPRGPNLRTCSTIPGIGSPSHLTSCRNERMSRILSGSRPPMVAPVALATTLVPRSLLGFPTTFVTTLADELLGEVALPPACLAFAGAPADRSHVLLHIPILFDIAAHGSDIHEARSRVPHRVRDKVRTLSLIPWQVVPSPRPGEHLKDNSNACLLIHLLAVVPMKSAHADLPLFNLKSQFQVGLRFARRHGPPEVHQRCRRRGRVALLSNRHPSFDAAGIPDPPYHH